jgi:hypothetical protein
MGSEDQHVDDNGGDEVEIAKPIEGAGIKCSVCGARPFPGFPSDAPDCRQDFDLMKIGNEWFCSQHQPRKRS